MKKVLTMALIAAILTTNLSGCGTILHPDRKGQIDGRIDPAIAVLDAVGLLFFLIPGVIAFAVDFSNGTIYLPAGKGAFTLDKGQMDELTQNGKINYNSLSVIVSNKMEANITVDPSMAIIQKL